jgi:hypothetical protein
MGAGGKNRCHAALVFHRSPIRRIDRTGFRQRRLLAAKPCANTDGDGHLYANPDADPLGDGNGKRHPDAHSKPERNENAEPHRYIYTRIHAYSDRNAHHHAHAQQDSHPNQYA